MPNDLSHLRLVLLPGDSPLDHLLEHSRDQAFTELHVAVAFATEQGVNLLASVMKEHPSWEGAVKKFLIGIDHGVTQPQALRTLCTLPQSQVRIPNFEEVISHQDFLRQNIFHPKVYSLRLSASEFTLFVGSPNLTGGGLKTNVEAGVIIFANQMERPQKRHIWRKFSGWWNRLWQNCEDLTNNDIVRYEEQRLRLRAKRPDQFLAEEPSPTELAGAGSFWIEAGFLSGGSHNQLELPNGVEAFFGIPEASPDVVQNLTLQIEEKSWSSWIRFWGNQVWRLRLPTVRDGLGNYENRLIRFDRTRQTRRFSIQITPLEGVQSQQWRGRSLEMGTLRQTQPVEGGREYGWF